MTAPSLSASQYVAIVGRAARQLARLELKRSRLRRELKATDRAIRDAKRNLRLVAAAVEPYDPPTKGAPDAF